MTNRPRFYLVEADMLPEIFIKVMDAKGLLEAGDVKTVAEAVNKVGISRSAFYKYKDSIAPFRDMKRDNIITFSMMLRDQMGVLSSVLAIFARTGANILTINQNIPVNGTAAVTIAAVVGDMQVSTEELMNQVQTLDGVLKIEALAG